MFGEQRVALCTIVARNYLALAGSFLASVAEFEPGFDRFVFILDDVDGVETFAEGTILRPPDAFDAAAFSELARGYNVVELATAVKPFVMRYLLDRNYERVLYFDPDIQVFAGLDAVLEPLESNDIALTPHWVDALPLADRLRLEVLVLQTGVFNLGFIGVANTPAARTMLDWWAERLMEYCRKNVLFGLFVDQRWIDLVPALFARTAIVRHRGCNVAFWNIRERRLAASDDLRLESGEPVVFFHFSGFDARTPSRISRHRNRIPLADMPRVQQLLNAYAQRVIARGHLERASMRFGLRRSLKAQFRAAGRGFSRGLRQKVQAHAYWR